MREKGIVNEHISSTKLGLKGIPALAEVLHVARELTILEYTGGKLHIPTISTSESIALISNAKAKGLVLAAAWLFQIYSLTMRCLMVLIHITN